MTQQLLKLQLRHCPNHCCSQNKSDHAIFSIDETVDQKRVKRARLELQKPADDNTAQDWSCPDSSKPQKTGYVNIAVHVAQVQLQHLDNESDAQILEQQSTTFPYSANHVLGVLHFSVSAPSIEQLMTDSDQYSELVSLVDSNQLSVLDWARSVPIALLVGLDGHMSLKFPPSNPRLHSNSFKHSLPDVVLTLAPNLDGHDQFWNSIHCLSLNNIITLDASIQFHQQTGICSTCNNCGKDCAQTATIRIEIRHSRYEQLPFNAAKLYKNQWCELFDLLYPSTYSTDPLNLLDVVVSHKATTSIATQPHQLVSRLLAFQMQSLSWMLDCERGVSLSKKLLLPTFWETVHSDSAFGPIYINRLDGTFTFDKNLIQDKSSINAKPFYGGILAHEMGLGKTVILIALFLLHQLSNTSTPTLEEVTKQAQISDLKVCNATLVVAPGAIIDQWANEIHQHAPSLRVLVYEKKSNADQFDSVDIVLVTSDVLRREFHAANPPPERSRRQQPKYKRRRSCLVEQLWWRVVFDEAQMVDSSISNIAAMARLIPRIHPWAVTGTPTSKTGLLSDMHGLFCFLGLNTWIAASLNATPKPHLSSFTEQHLRLTHRHPGLVRDHLARIMHRFTKVSVASELEIPPQHEHIINVQFDRTHQLYYDEIEEKCLQAVKNRVQSQSFIPYIDTMQKSPSVQDQTESMHLSASKHGSQSKQSDLPILMLQLRQTCCHPQIGTHNRRRLGGVLCTMEHVLTTMIRQCTSSVYTMQHKRISTSMELLHMLEYQGKFKPALDSYLILLKETREVVAGIRLDVDTLMTRKKLKNQERSENELALNNEDQPAKACDDNDESDLDCDFENFESSNPTQYSYTLLEDELGQLRSRLNFWIELEHRLLYFIATSYYIIGKRIEDAAITASGELHSDKDAQSFVNNRDEESGFTRQECEELENIWYEHANKLRRTTLQIFELRTTQMVEKFQSGFLELPGELNQKASVLSNISKNERILYSNDQNLMLIVLSPEYFGGIVTGEIFEEITQLVAVLNKQWQLIEAWRSKLIELLTLPFENENLNSNSDHTDISCFQTIQSLGVNSNAKPNDGSIAAPTGNEYSIGLDIQEEANQYQYAYIQVLSDRLTLLTAMRRDVDHKYYGTTDLQFKLFEQRKAFILKQKQQSFSELVKRLKGVSCRYDLPSIEIQLATHASLYLGKCLDVHVACLELLRNETTKFSILGNARIVYFRELQKFHSGVVFPEKPTDMEAHCTTLEDNIRGFERSIATQNARLRYLATLETDNIQRTALGESLRECGICRTMFKNGVVTHCGHMFCEECNAGWIMIHLRCPMCNQSISRESIAKVTLKKQLDTPQFNQTILSISTVPNAFSAGSKSIAQLNIPQLAKRLNAIKVHGSYGSKFNTIIRHIKYLVSTHPQTKVILFSQWEQVLNILAAAFQDNGIGFVKMEGSGWTQDRGKFKLKFPGQSVTTFSESGDVVAFMLNAKSHSSGLTLVCAMHVILIEPLLNRSIEQQAITRVHRIGQQNETHVWRYIVHNTIEKQIVKLADQRMSVSNQITLSSQSRLATKSLGGGELIGETDIQDILCDRNAVNAGTS
ncbi:hypothetical protein BDV3_000875 [Batrachochytrium dendrobatidis]|nr:hypothetical protein BDEG_20428 [Batrachochytrium dendrobatidis JEL423]